MLSYFMLDARMRIHDNIDPNWATEVCKWSVTITICSFPYIGKSKELDYVRKSARGDQWFKSSTIMSSQSVRSKRFTATIEMGTFTINDNDMLSYSLTTMMYFLTKEWYDFKGYTVNFFIKAYHKITYKEDLKITQKRCVLEMICLSLWFWPWCAFYNRSLKKHIISNWFLVFSPLRRHRMINTWSILTNEVSKLLWFNFLLHAVIIFEQ